MAGDGTEGTEVIIGADGKGEEVDGADYEAAVREHGDRPPGRDDDGDDVLGVVDPDPDLEDDVASRLERTRLGRRDAARELELLAESASGKPLFANEVVTEPVPFPGSDGESWFVPRLMSPEQQRQYREIAAGKPNVHMGGEAGDDIDYIATRAVRVAPYAFLVQHSIAQLHLVRANEAVVELDAVAVRKHGPEIRRTLTQELEADHADWLELWLEDFNGVTAAQERARGLSSGSSED